MRNKLPSSVKVAIARMRKERRRIEELEDRAKYEADRADRLVNIMNRERVDRSDAFGKACEQYVEGFVMPKMAKHIVEDIAELTRQQIQRAQGEQVRSPEGDVRILIRIPAREFGYQVRRDTIEIEAFHRRRFRDF